VTDDASRPRLTPSDPSSLSRSAAADPSLEVDGDGIAWVTFDSPTRKLNVLDGAVVGRLAAIIEQLGSLTAGDARVVVFRSGKPDSFIVGADVDAIQAIESASEAEAAVRYGQDVYVELEQLPLPTVAAIHGLCLGGGTELSLACRFRLASDSAKTKIGLPEVQLGILPAWGGTTRLPRLVGLRAALEMLLTGNPVSASKARRIGLVSDVVPAELFTTSVRDFALRAISLPPGASRRKRPLLGRVLEDTPPGRLALLAAARRSVLSKTGGHYPAPLAILDVLRRGAGASALKSFALEAKAAGDLIVSPVSKSLIHVFQLREQSRKRPEAAPGSEPKPIERMAILGAGVMGGGVAQLVAYNGVRVRMKDIRHEAIASGLQHARSLFDGGVKKRRMSPREAAQRMELISGGLDYSGFGSVDLVVEAVVEKMDVKRAVLREVEDVVSEECILTTNTSSLSVDAMAEVLERPGHFCGMHFFNPVHKMPLVEVVRGAKTEAWVIATVHALAVRLGKVPVVVHDGPGFLVNRILGPYLNEAGWLLADGASIEDVDEAATAFGMPMGPLRLLDEIGIDVARHAGNSLHEVFGERLAPSPALAAIGATERLGKKNELGFYEYDDDEDGEVDEGVYAELGLRAPSDGSGPPQREIRSRLVVSMINEAARTLEDRIVESAGDVDLAMVMGTGFPPFRGGLLKHADSVGTRALVELLNELQAKHGVRFQPAPVLEELGRTNARFYDVFP
jgi:3-hydroxyacyl-CoA dehydrogenase/enoyl-CoA hydratase/3-hydroxybutyryl-CoA epimerase